MRLFELTSCDRLEYIEVELKDELRRLTSEVDQLKSELRTRPTTTAAVKSLENPESSITAVIDDALKEQRQQENKKNNVIFFGIPEVASGNPDQRYEADLTTVNQVCNNLLIQTPDSYSEVRRMGNPRVDNKPRPVVVKFHACDGEKRKTLLMKAKELNQLDVSNPFRKIYIRPDLTIKQLTESRKLQDELKARRENGEDVVIRNMKVVSRRGYQGTKTK